MQALTAARNDLLRTQLSLAVLPERTAEEPSSTRTPRSKKWRTSSRRATPTTCSASSAIRRRSPRRDGLSRSRLRAATSARTRSASSLRLVQPRGESGERSPVTGDALSALLPDAGKPLALNLAAFAKPDGDGASVHITLNAGAFVRVGATTALDISAIAVDQAGVQRGSVKQTSTLAAVRSDQNRTSVVNVPTYMDLAPGDYEIRVAVVDRSVGTSASVFSQILVPKFSTERLSLSDVVVETGPATLPSGAAPAISATATTERAFDRGDQVRAFFQIYQGTARTDAIVPVTTRVRVIDSRGTVARDQSIVFAPADFHARRTDCRINVPIDGLTPGDYLLEIIATAGDEHRDAQAAVRGAIAAAACGMVAADVRCVARQGGWSDERPVLQRDRLYERRLPAMS